MTKTKGAPKGWKSTLWAVLKQHNGYSADGGKVASYATQKLRQDVLFQGFSDLRKMGFRVNTVYALRTKHIERLMEKWDTEGLSSATLQNRLSVFRTFSRWIDKPGLVRAPEHYVADKRRVQRSYVAKAAKTWEAKGVDALAKIRAVREENPRFGTALALQLGFGLRSKESLLLRPHLADKGQVLMVEHGTKGGRTRYIPITTPEQRAILEYTKQAVETSKSLVPKQKTYAQFRNAYYYTLRKNGISRKDGIVAHGLRHQHLGEVYTAATGEVPPTAGGNLAKTNPELDSLGRKLVAERAGHSRESIASAYLGGKQ